MCYVYTVQCGTHTYIHHTCTTWYSTCHVMYVCATCAHSFLYECAHVHTTWTMNVHTCTCMYVYVVYVVCTADSRQQTADSSAPSTVVYCTRSCTLYMNVHTRVVHGTTYYWTCSTVVVVVVVLDTPSTGCRAVHVHVCTVHGCSCISTRISFFNFI